MEAVLHTTAEPKAKDFNSCKDNAIGKVNVNRGKKPKKKKTKVIKNASGGGSGSYDRLHPVPLTYGYASVASNRQRGNRMATDNYSEQTGIAVVDEILQSISQARATENNEIEGSEKQSDESPDMQDDVETSRDGSSPDTEGQISPLKTESESSSLQGRRDDAKKREQLAFAMNDFEEEEVYIRRNRSVGSLARVGSGTLPASSGPDATTTHAATPPTPTPEHPIQKKPIEKQGLRYVNGLPSSPTTSPHRLNFRSANGLLQANGDGRSPTEEHGSSVAPTNSHPRQAAVYSGDVVMEHLPQTELEQGLQPAMSLQALLLGNSHQQMTSLTHQMAAHLSPQIPIGNLQVSAMGHPAPAMQSVFTLAPHQQMLQGHHPALLGNFPSHSGLPIGALLAQEQQLRGGNPEPMRNGGNEFRKPKEDIFEDPACFYMKRTNDLDRFLAEATPTLQLDPSLDPLKAHDQLTLEDVWKFYYDCSMLGKEIPLHGSASAKENHCGPSTAYYLPYLSGIQIFTPEDVYASDGSNLFLSDVQGWPAVMRMQYEQFEVNPPWFRLPLYDMMDELSLHVPELKTLKLKDLHPASWFCVAWYPLYRIPDAPLGTRFLTFHMFHPSVHATSTVGRGGSVPLAVHGLEWYNMADELWLDNIKVTKPIRSPSPSKPTDNRHEGVTGEVVSSEQRHWMSRIRELRCVAKTFARGLGFRRSTPHGLADANTHHHDFEYFYERN